MHMSSSIFVCSVCVVCSVRTLYRHEFGFVYAPFYSVLCVYIHTYISYRGLARVVKVGLRDVLHTHTHTHTYIIHTYIHTYIHADTDTHADIHTDVGYGVWDMGYGSMEYGVRSMEYGLWSMEYGVWSMEYGMRAEG